MFQAELLTLGVVIAILFLSLVAVAGYTGRRGDWLTRRRGSFDDLDRVDCKNCDGYGFVFLDGSIVPREIRRDASYGENTGYIHSLAAITKPCRSCLGMGTVLVEVKEVTNG